MPLPRVEPLLRPVLQVLADSEEHRVKEIRDRVQAEFKVSQQERRQKNKAGTSVFVNRVAGALARLHMETGPMGHPKAITLVNAKKKTYKITEFGAELLKRHPSYLSFEDLKG
jgi:restriction system protein